MLLPGFVVKNTELFKIIDPTRLTTYEVVKSPNTGIDKPSEVDMIKAAQKGRKQHTRKKSVKANDDILMATANTGSTSTGYNNGAIIYNGKAAKVHVATDSKGFPSNCDVIIFIGSWVVKNHQHLVVPRMVTKAEKITTRLPKR